MAALWHLNKYFYKYRFIFSIGIVFVIISVVFSVIPAQYVRESFNIVEEALRQAREAEEYSYSELYRSLLLYGLIIMGASLLKGAFTFFTRQTIIVMSRKIEFDLKNEIFQQYQRLSTSFYRRNSTGDLMNRISEDVSRVRMYIGPAMMYAINVVFTLIIVIYIMVNVNARLTLYVLAPLPILSYLIYRVSRLINIHSEKVQKQLSKMSTLVQETFSGIRVVKAYAKEEHFSKIFAKDAQTYSEVNEKLYRVNALFMPLMLMLIGLSTLFTIYIGGQEAIAGKITAGNIAEFVLYVNMLTWPIASIGWVSSLVQRAEASQRRINEFLKLEPEIKNTNTEDFDFKGNIEFKNVSFTYPDTGIQALKKLSFSMKAGQTLAIIGKTGSGKSTVAALVARLFDANEGQILVDEVPIQDVNLDEFRAQMGFVPQDSFLFSDSLQNNIAFGVGETSLEEVIEASKAADFHKNVLDFPEQYQTRVGERGITLSGGQKQRLSIARAIIKKPKLFVFDDCLSAVDTETEENILNNLKKILEQSSAIIISHRVSSVKNADEIIVLEDGAVLERGSHQQLLEAKGYYHQLYEQQLVQELTP